MYPFYALVSRLKYIDRWALMRNSERENVMEHSYMVAVLAHALGVIRRDVFKKDCSPESLAAFALFHDAPEIITGDMPTPVKYHDGNMISAYREIEKGAVKKLVGALPESMQGEYGKLLDGEKELVKAADKLSAYIKCLEELKCGNDEFKSASESTLGKLRAMEIPEIDYFLDNFIGAFTMSLDELQL